MPFMQEADHTLELSPETMRRMVEGAMERIVEHLASLPDQPNSSTEGGPELARSVSEPLPREGRPFEELLATLFERYVPASYLTPGPGYLAYIPGGGLFHAAVADLIASSINRYVGVWAAAPALAQLEATVVQWLCGIMGYPTGSGGLLTTGGSLANLEGIVTARRERLPESFLSGTIYTSDQAHHSVRKAALLAGFPAANVRSIESDARFRVRLDVLRDRIRRDRAAGHTPFLVVGQAGTTNTGAVDDLDALADVARDERLWLHVDAAYGGVFRLTARGRRALTGIERSDSLSLDPHKGLFLPYGTGSLLVRDRAALRRSHAVRADYLPPMQEDPEFVDFCESSAELSRGFRGLRLWLPIKMHGIGPFERNLEEKLDLTEWITAELRALDGIEIVAEPQLSIVVFRRVRPGLDEQGLDELNRRFLERINAGRRVHLTSTVLRGRFVIRICVLSFRTHLDRMRMALQDIRTALEP